MIRVISDGDSLAAAHREAVALLRAGNATAAVALADSCTASGSPHTENVLMLQAAMSTDGGHDLRDRTLVERGVALWRQLDPESKPSNAYNLANAELGIYEIGVADNDVAIAWVKDGHHLRSARRRYEEVGDNAAAPQRLRLQALTNAGNAYDNVGRYLDAVPLYERAIKLEPTFGMAAGNLGVALFRAAPFVRGHAPLLVHRAALWLDRAIQNSDSVLEFGSPSALIQFKDLRGKINIKSPSARIRAEPSTLGDPHLDWCLRQQLFLHVSPDCITEKSDSVDALYFRGVVTGIDDDGRRRARDLVDGFNVLKQEYIAARYAVWLANDRASPIREHAADISDHTVFLDSLEYGRWGVRTAFAIQSFAAATNLLDKVASFVHLYFHTTRRTNAVDFRALLHPKDKAPDSELVTALDVPERNLGLLALCDLSRDVADKTCLNRRFGLRHTATHRFLVAHTESVPPSDAWFDRVSWGDLIQHTIEQLQTSRAALTYLAWMIDAHERASRASNPKAEGGDGGSVIPPLPLTRVDTRQAEYE